MRIVQSRAAAVLDSAVWVIVIPGLISCTRALVSSPIGLLSRSRKLTCTRTCNVESPMLRIGTITLSWLDVATRSTPGRPTRSTSRSSASVMTTLLTISASSSIGNAA